MNPPSSNSNQPTYVSVPVAATAGGPPGTMPVAIPIGQRSYAGMATASMVLGVISLPLSIFTIFTAVIPVLGLIFGFISIKSPRRGMAVAGIVLSSLGLVATVAILIWGVNHQKQLKSSSTSSSGAASVDLRAVSTDCYKTQISQGFNLDQTAGPCQLKALRSDNSEEVVVKALYSTVTPTNFNDVMAADVANAVKNTPGLTITSQQAGTFAGHQAYIATGTYKEEADKIVYVYSDHSYTDSKYRVFIITDSTIAKTDSLKTLEDNWQWQ